MDLLKIVKTKKQIQNPNSCDVLILDNCVSSPYALSSSSVSFNPDVFDVISSSDESLPSFSMRSILMNNKSQGKPYLFFLIDVMGPVEVADAQKVLIAKIAPYFTALAKGEACDVPHIVVMGKKSKELTNEMVELAFGAFYKVSPRTGEQLNRKVRLTKHLLSEDIFLFSTVSAKQRISSSKDTLELVISRDEYESKVPKENLNSLSEYFSYFDSLVFFDDFNDNNLNENHFVFENQGFIRNKELQEYAKSISDHNIEIKDGILSLIGRKEEKNGQPYTSASLTTAGSSLFHFGRFEMRAKLPSKRGSWPAFWMLAQTKNMTGISEICGRWPESGEIDIMEYISEKEEKKIVHQTLHIAKGPYMEGLESSHGFFSLENATFDLDFHTFGFLWTDKKMVWYVDDSIVKELDVTDKKYDTFRSCYYYIIMNLAIGGAWPGAPDDDFIEDRFDIDYIKVYQKK